MKHAAMAMAAALLGWGLTGLVLVWVRNRQHLALPTERGLHAVATPVGGGLGMLGAAMVTWALVAWPLPPQAGAMAAALVALAALSWFDDRTSIPPAVRFAAQMLVIAVVLWYLPRDVRLLHTVPLAIERAAIGFAWLWMLNLTNFMDGIDGIAGTEAITVAAGYALVTQLFPRTSPITAALPELSLVLAAAAIGYLYWNWAPAKIFMGDVGSIPLGFLFGLLMFDLALRGLWAAAFILPLYFVADATIVLLDRIRRGIRPWQAHREHAYQQAVLAGMTHAQVTTHVAVLNVALVALAVLSVPYPERAVIAATGLTLALIVWLRTRVVLRDVSH